MSQQRKGRYSNSNVCAFSKDALETQFSWKDIAWNVSLLSSVLLRIKQPHSYICWITKSITWKTLEQTPFKSCALQCRPWVHRCTYVKHKTSLCFFFPTGWPVTAGQRGWVILKDLRAFNYCHHRCPLGSGWEKWSKPLSGLSVRQHIHPAKKGKGGTVSWITTPGSNEIGMHTPQPLASTQPCEM